MLEVVVGVDTSDPMVFDCGQTRTLIDGVAHVIKNECMKLTATNIGGNANEFELDDSFLGGCRGINYGFHNQANHNFIRTCCSKKTLYILNISFIGM